MTCGQVCYLSGADDHRHLGLRRLIVVPVTAVCLRPGHSPLIFVTACTHRSLHTLSSSISTSVNTYCTTLLHILHKHVLSLHCWRVTKYISIHI